MALLLVVAVFALFGQAHSQDWRCIGPEPRLYGGCAPDHTARHIPDATAAPYRPPARGKPVPAVPAGAVSTPVVVE